MFGRVTRFLHNKNYGFIYGEDGNTYFVHGKVLKGEYLDKGYYVFFRSYRTKKSDYNACNVNVIEVPERIKKS